MSQAGRLLEVTLGLIDLEMNKMLIFNHQIPILNAPSSVKTHDYT